MKIVGRSLIIVVVVLAVAYGVSLLALPATAAKSQAFDVPMSPPSVVGRFSTMPANTQLGEGITATHVASSANNTVVADIAYADGGKGKATFAVTPGAQGQGSHVEVKIERDLGFNPLDRFNGRDGAPVAPAAAAFFPAVGNDLTHPTASGRNIEGTTYTGLAYEVTQVTAQQFAYNEYCSPQQPDEIKEAVRQSLVAVRAFLNSHQLASTGNPIAVETGWNEQTHEYCFQIGVPFTGAAPSRIYVAGVKVGPTPAGQAMRVHYNGTEENVIPTYDQMELALWASHMDIDKSYEVYYDDPMQPAGSQNRDIFYVFSGDAATLRRIAPPAGSPPPAGAAATPAAATTTSTATTSTSTATTTP